MQKHNDTMKTSGHSSLEKYTSHFIERVVCERELETEQNCNILTPTLMAITAFFPVLLGCSTGGLGAQPLCDTILIPASLQLQLLNRGPEGPLCWWFSLLHLISHWRPLNSTCRQSNLSPWYLRPDAPVIYTGAFPILTGRPGSICNNQIPI